jgi:CYTH domain-containing protein
MISMNAYRKESMEEIERKFLIRDLPVSPDTLEKQEIRQGYLCSGEQSTEVRVREKSGAHFITVKQGQGAVRREVEISITEEDFLALWPMTKGKRVIKTRHIYPTGKETAEIDIYHGTLKGLKTAEVEFPDRESCRGFTPFSWMGREITDDLRYTNSSLAVHGIPEEHGSRESPDHRSGK